MESPRTRRCTERKVGRGINKKVNIKNTKKRRGNLNRTAKKKKSETNTEINEKKKKEKRSVEGVFPAPSEKEIQAKKDVGKGELNQLDSAPGKKTD